MRFNIIGAGRLGKNLALSLNADSDTQLIAVCNHNLQNAIAAVETIDAGHAVTLANLPAVDLTFITTPDDRIATIAADLTSNRLIAPGSIVAHCSGTLGSDALKPLQEIGCLIASIHPLRAFRANYVQNDAFHGCDCVVEGDSIAVERLTALFTRMGAHVIPMKTEKKAVYHAAAVMASNYVITLAGCAVDLLQETGLTETQALHMTQRLMASSLANLQHTPHVNQALTGPIARGDLYTISKHVQAITVPHINALYRAAGLATLPLTNLDNETQTALTACLLNFNNQPSG